MSVIMLMVTIIISSLVLSWFNLAIVKGIKEMKEYKQENEELVELAKTINKEGKQNG